VKKVEKSHETIILNKYNLHIPGQRGKKNSRKINHYKTFSDNVKIRRRGHKEPRAGAGRVKISLEVCCTVESCCLGWGMID
jgi:hypothetical protein